MSWGGDAESNDGLGVGSADIAHKLLRLWGRGSWSVWG